MTIDEWLRHATNDLKNKSINTARLDAELILAHALGRDRVYLHAHGERPIQAQAAQEAHAGLERRKQRTPLAYILGRKEFYGRDFKVTPYVLIPRPETETLIEVIESLDLRVDARIADIGTGSGVIAITLQLNQPERHIIATDISSEALAVAEENARELGADIIFLQGDLAKPLRNPVDMIVANLPYVDLEWKRSPETDFEPKTALFAENHGLALIQKLISQTSQHLAASGYLILEADPEQHATIMALANKNNLQHIRTEDYCICFRKSA